MIILPRRSACTAPVSALLSSVRLKQGIRMTLFQVLFFVSALLITNGLSAQGNSLLWRITGKNIPVSYLYGTMHSSDPRVFHFADSVMPAFESCDAFVMEVIPGDSLQQILERSIYMNGNQSLKSLLKQSQYDSVQWFAMQHAGIPITFIERMKPLYVAMMLEIMSDADSSSNQVPFLDEYLQQEAQEQRKKIMGLESVREQLRIFDVVNYADQAKLLMHTIRDYSTDTTGYERMIGYYLSNNLHEMMQFENDFSLPDSLYRALITERNLTMAVRIDSIIRQQSTFIAVGAGHLGDTGGLIELLRQKGYTVLPVIPEYHRYGTDGWYNFTSIRNGFSAGFPGVPVTRTDSVQDKPVWIYELSNSVSDSLGVDLRVMVFPALADDNDIRVFLSSRHIADIEMKAHAEEKSFSFQRDGKMKGHCTFIYSGDKRYVIVYASAHKSKTASRFAASFTLL